jgi:hypothetical protein
MQKGLGFGRHEAAAAWLNMLSKHHVHVVWTGNMLMAVSARLPATDKACVSGRISCASIEILSQSR